MRQFVRTRNDPFVKQFWKGIKKERARLRRLNRRSKYSQFDAARRAEAFERAAKLRQNATPAETRFLQELKARNIDHIFQYVMFFNHSAYRIADFYLPRYKAIIELDGSAHDIPETKAYDEAKDKQTNIKVVRFKNHEIYQPSFFENLIATVLKKPEKSPHYQKVRIYPSCPPKPKMKTVITKKGQFQLQKGYTIEDLKRIGAL